jgi:3-dehydroquinate synthase
MKDMPPAVLHRVPIALGDRSYEILIGAGLLQAAPAWEGLPRPSSVMVVSNPTVWPLLGARLMQGLGAAWQGATGAAPKIRQVLVPDGEAHKTWTSLNLVFDALLAAGCDRQVLIVALGGGVVGDLAGFAAACFMRGVRYVQVPTTLLAQVDSSVGGKTAVNHPLGKNMVGAFYQPSRVLADLDSLATLPAREVAAGLAEVIKYGPIADAGFLAWIDANLPALRRLEPEAVAHAVRRSCEIKAWVVGADETEQGLRAILNFGHTFGHAIEAGLGYGEWLHGEAVGCGMVMAADLSARLGGLSVDEVGHLTDLIARAGLPVTGPKLGTERYLSLMRGDKKSVAGAIQFVVIQGMGRAVLQRADDALVREVIDAHC